MKEQSILISASYIHSHSRKVYANHIMQSTWNNNQYQYSWQMQKKIFIHKWNDIMTCKLSDYFKIMFVVNNEDLVD